MGNKIKNIRLANLLLEKRYLKEQGIPTGSTQTTGTTQTTIPQKSEQKTPSIVGVTEKDIKNGKYQRCTGTPDLIGKVGNYSLHNNNGSICVG